MTELQSLSKDCEMLLFPSNPDMTKKRILNSLSWTMKIVKKTMIMMNTMIVEILVAMMKMIENRIISKKQRIQKSPLNQEIRFLKI